MPLARRDLLGLGAAVALSTVASACRSAPPAGPRPAVRSSPAVVPPTTPAGPVPAAFPGQPAPGSLYYGASVPYHRSLSAWEQELGAPLAVNRSYFTADRNETTQLVRRCRDDLAHGRLPHVSMKPAWTWRDVASGRRDAWLAGILRPLGSEEAPVFLTLHHEPENEAGPAGMQPSDYVAMQRRAIRLAAGLAPNVTITPVLQHWTFDPLHDNIDPSVWIVPEAALVGIDVYNPWSPTNGKEWRSFGSKIDEVAGWFGDTPIVIGEYGCRDDPDNRGLAAEWLRDAADYARTHNIVAMSYFNSGANSPEGPWVLRGRTERAFAGLLGSDWVARPA